MSKILEVLRMHNKGSYALVDVVMEDGTEAYVWIGGDCEVFFDKGRIKAFVKKPPKAGDKPMDNN